MKRAPSVGLFHYQAGRILWRKSDFALALAEVTTALSLEPNMIDAHLFVGQIFFRDQEFGKAARHFQAVLKVRPHDPTALMGLAECNIQSGDARGAMEYLERGNKKFPDEPLFAIRTAEVLELYLNDFAGAIERYKEILANARGGRYKNKPEMNIAQKILDLEMSSRAGRATASVKELK